MADAEWLRLHSAAYGFPASTAARLERIAAALSSEREILRERLGNVADFLVDQRDEPWPRGSESDRLHYWRDKAIEAANRITAALDTGVTGG